MHGRIYQIKRLILVLAAFLSLTAFIIPAYKMAGLMKADKHFNALVLQGNAFFNLSGDYINRAVPLRMIVTPSGYSMQSYIFPKAHVNIINERNQQTILINNVKLQTIPVIFSRNNLLALLTGLYLSGTPQQTFTDMGLDLKFTAYGLANDRAAYIIGNDNDQLFIDNEKTVPIMFRIKYNNVYTEAVVKDYMDSAKLMEGPIRTAKPNSESGFARLQAERYTDTDIILPRTIELYDGNVMAQKWVFTEAFLLTGDQEIKHFILTWHEVTKLPLSHEPLSPFMLF